MDDSKTTQIEGGIPLVGNVKVSGSRALALKLIYASILSGEECTLSNVPKAKYVLDDLKIAHGLGVKTRWVGNNKLIINSHDLNGSEIPRKAEKISTSAFLIPALVHKFGKAVLPKGPRAAQYTLIWESFGMEVRQDFENLYIEAVKLQSGEVVLPYSSRVLTDISIITALFVLGESVILNASTDVETDDLIDFCNKIGGDVKRRENGVIVVNGSGVFRGINYTLPYDREEAAFFIIATLLTNGNATLLDIERSRLLPFINWLSKVGASYEFSGSDMRVWHNSGSGFESTQVSVSPHPGFITDFAPMAVFLSCFASGESVLTESRYVSNLEYIKNLNRLGSNIDIIRGEEGIEIKVIGPAKFIPGQIMVSDLRYALISLLYALCVEGKNELSGFRIIENGFENITDRLRSLGASIVVDGL